MVRSGQVMLVLLPLLPAATAPTAPTAATATACCYCSYCYCCYFYCCYRYYWTANDASKQASKHASKHASKQCGGQAMPSHGHSYIHTHAFRICHRLQKPPPETRMLKSCFVEADCWYVGRGEKKQPGIQNVEMLKC